MQGIWRQLGLFGSLGLLLGACQGFNLQDSLAPDPGLIEGQDESTSPTITNLPGDFPSDIPLYPNGTLIQASSNSSLWAIADSIDQLEAFYREAFASEPWRIQASLHSPNQPIYEILARNSELEVIVSLAKDTAPNPQALGDAVLGTTFTLQYRFLDEAVGPDDTVESDILSEESNSKGQDPRVDALIQLSVFSTSAFRAEATITRRQFARWLLRANNRIFGDRPNLQIRLPKNSATPIYNDVPRSDSDFVYIQGLAEAGLLPSKLTNDALTSFRPDDPLTREALIAWKVPFDLRQPLPQTSLENISETWGFPDAPQIETNAIQGLYADYQNGDQSNIRRIYGYIAIFQPKNEVTHQEAAIALSYFGYQGEGRSAQAALSSGPTSTSPNADQ